MTSFFSFGRPELAIDFGTANLRVVRRAEGVVFDEPSLCCFKRGPGRPSLHAAGREAEAMVDREPAHLQVKRPLVRGVLQDIDVARNLLQYAVRRVLGRQSVRRPRVMMGVPADATQAERAALVTAAEDAGLGAVTLVVEPLAAAHGAAVAIDTPTGAMIVECGAGTTEVAVLSLGGICLTRSVRVGGADLDAALADHLHSVHRFLVGDLTAERVKQDYVARRSGGVDGPIKVRGRNLKTGFPGSVDIDAAELDPLVERHAGRVVDLIQEALEITPPELSHDIHERGIVLTGGGATTPMIERLVAERIGVAAQVAERPAHCVAEGLHRLLTH